MRRVVALLALLASYGHCLRQSRHPAVRAAAAAAQRSYNGAALRRRRSSLAMSTTEPTWPRATDGAAEPPRTADPVAWKFARAHKESREGPQLCDVNDDGPTSVRCVAPSERYAAAQTVDSVAATPRPRRFGRGDAAAFQTRRRDRIDAAAATRIVRGDRRASSGTSSGRGRRGARSCSRSATRTKKSWTWPRGSART